MNGSSGETGFRTTGGLSRATGRTTGSGGGTTGGLPGMAAHRAPREVLEVVAKGHSNAEIAAALFVSPATVKTHISRLLMKLDARDRAQLVMIAYETGMVAPGAP